MFDESLFEDVQCLVGMIIRLSRMELNAEPAGSVTDLTTGR